MKVTVELSEEASAIVKAQGNIDLNAFVSAGVLELENNRSVREVVIESHNIMLEKFEEGRKADNILNNMMAYVIDLADMAARNSLVSRLDTVELLKKQEGVARAVELDSHFVLRAEKEVKKARDAFTDHREDMRKNGNA